MLSQEILTNKNQISQETYTKTLLLQAKLAFFQGAELPRNQLRRSSMSSRLGQSMVKMGVLGATLISNNLDYFGFVV